VANNEDKPVSNHSEGGNLPRGTVKGGRAVEKKKSDPRFACRNQTKQAIGVRKKGEESHDGRND